MPAIARPKSDPREKPEIEPRAYRLFPNSPITERPALTWPGGARIALWVAPNIEFFPLDEKVFMGVGIVGLEPVGNYAVRITFDDLHDTGIFSWQYLYGLGTDKEAVWAQYLDALERSGLSRDP